MKEKYDLKQMDRRMPYTVPDNFFEDMEKNILMEIRKDTAATVKHRRSHMRVAFMSIASIAAAALLAVVFTHGIDKRQDSTDGFADVEQAFAQLNSADQDYLIEVYQNDIFLDEQQFNN